MKKGLIIAAVVVVVAIGGVLFFGLSQLDTIVAAAIEKYGSEVTETEVGVSGVDISITQGRGSIQGLRVASPEGYSVGDAFALGDITVDIDLESLGDDPIVIDEIRIAAPVVNAEINATGASNIDELRKTIQTHTPAVAGDGDAGEQATRIRIAKFIFEQGSVAVDASALGLDPRTVDLPEIRLDDIGGAQGALPAEIAKVALTALAKQAVNEIAASEIDRLVKEKLGGSVTDAAKGLIDKLGK